MKRKKKAGHSAIINIALLVLALGVYVIMPFGKTAPFTASAYRYGPDYYKELDGIPVVAQETAYTCGVASMVIVKDYLGAHTTEQELRSELGLLERTTGLIPRVWLPLAQKAFEPLSYSVTRVNPIAQAEILNVISASLEEDLPVIFLWSTQDDWHKPRYDTHYSVLYGIDMKNERVKVSNPYGYLQELSFAELFAGLDFTSYEAEPLIHRLGRKAGVIDKNNLLVFSNAG